MFLVAAPCFAKIDEEYKANGYCIWKFWRVANSLQLVKLNPKQDFDGRNSKKIQGNASTFVVLIDMVVLFSLIKLLFTLVLLMSDSNLQYSSSVVFSDLRASQTDINSSNPAAGPTPPRTDGDILPDQSVMT